MFSVLGNIRRRIFCTISVLNLEIYVDGYFKTNIFPQYVIDIQRLQKTEKLATEDGYSKKRRRSVSHRVRSIQNSKKNLEEKNIRYPFSVEQRHSLKAGGSGASPPGVGYHV